MSLNEKLIKIMTLKTALQLGIITTLQFDKLYMELMK